MTHIRGALTTKLGLIVALCGLEQPGYGAQTVPDYVRVKSISYAGSGCPAGTVAVNVSPDSRAFTLLFDSFKVSRGPGQPISQMRKNCQINIDLDFTQGFSFAVGSIDFRGVGFLGTGESATAQAVYYYQGIPTTARFNAVVTGPLAGDWRQTASVFPSGTLVWSPCGSTRALNLNTQLRLQASNGASQARIALGNLDDEWVPYELSPATRLDFFWRRCNH